MNELNRTFLSSGREGAAEDWSSSPDSSRLLDINWSFLAASYASDVTMNSFALILNSSSFLISSGVIDDVFSFIPRQSIAYILFS